MRERVRGLDGVRAVAVVAVMLFHAEVPWARGGFLGVDLFFVLSGFLITTLLISEREATGRIDLRAFYIRRARRLLPAIALLVAALLIMGGLIARDAGAALREDLPWAAGFLLNWHYIAADHTYFATMARPPLLQHMWSLAIEEQFYIVWPALLIVLTRLRSSLFSTRHLVFAVSIAGAAASAVHMAIVADALRIPMAADPVRVYFGTDTHAFGLLIGCATAALWIRPGCCDTYGPAHLRSVRFLGYGSLAVVIVSLAVADGTSTSMYRGAMAGFAVAAAALVALAGHPALPLVRVMAARPLAWVGERSYGMYLWHWPVFTLLRPGVDTALPDTAVQVLRFAIVVAVSAASYRWIEQPIRRGHITWPSYQPRLAAATALSGALLASGAVGVWTAPSPDQVSLASMGTVAEVADDMGADLLALKGNAPPPYHRTVVFGDSVVLSGRTALKATLGDIAIDAKVGRQPREIAQHIIMRRAKGKLGEDVVIHMGTNGTVTLADLQPILDSLSDRRRVVVVNVRVPRTWMKPSNAVINELVTHYPNVRLADWDAVGRGHRRYFTPDGVHLTARGGTAFAQMVDEALHQP